MREKYRDTGRPIIRVAEECAEVIKAIMKAERFGYDNFHPDNAPPCHSKPKEEWCDREGPGGFMGHPCGGSKTNRDEIREEFSDLLLAWADFTKEARP